LLDADVWCAPVYSFADLEKDPQIAENGMIIEFEHPTAGTFRAMGLPVKFDGTPGGIRYPAPLLGQHSEMILREYAGLDDARIGALLESGVVINRAASNG
jgi:crotonobetainyl-CoA:carnitine CoA-transferase CaiB-like acyl-CoA transferase